MQKNRFNVSIIAAAVFALTVLFIPIGDAFAQTQVPLFGDENVASIRVGPEVWVAPVELKAELEAHHGQSADVSTLGEVIGGLLPAGSGDTVRFEGGWAAGEAALQLDALGYTEDAPRVPVLPSAGIASVLSD